MSDNVKTSSVITEEDIAALDTQSALDEPLEATDPINMWFLRVGTWACVALTIIMTVLVTVAVLWRYVLNSSIDLASEAPSYLLPWLVCFGAIVAQAQMAHVGVNFFLEKFKGKAFEYMSIGIWIFVAIVMAYMTYLGIYMAGPMAQQETPIMHWPQLGSFASFIVMTASLCIQSLVRAWYFYKNGALHTVDMVEESAATQEA